MKLISNWDSNFLFKGKGFNRREQVMLSLAYAIQLKNYHVNGKLQQECEDHLDPKLFSLVVFSCMHTSFEIIFNDLIGVSHDVKAGYV